MVNTEVILIIFFATIGGEALHSQKKKKKKTKKQTKKTGPGVDCGSEHELLTAEFRLKLKKVEKTTGHSGII